MLYRFVAWLLVPLAWWGRLRVDGVEQVPEAGPLLVVPNHDSQMDPVLIALALRKRRALRFLGRAELWRNRPLGWLLYGMNQIPIKRGAGDAEALAEAVETLVASEAICIFPEGKLSSAFPDGPGRRSSSSRPLPCHRRRSIHRTSPRRCSARREGEFRPSRRAARRAEGPPFGVPGAGNHRDL